MKSIFDKLLEELNEETLDEAVKVKTRNVRKIQKPKDSDSSGDSGDGKDDESESGKQSDSGKSSDQGQSKESGQGGESSKGEDGEPTSGEGEGEDGEPTPGEGEEGDGGGNPLDDDTGEPRVPDSHDPMYKGGKGGSFKDVFKKVYKEAAERAESGSKGGYGSGEGGILSKIKDFAYPPLDVDEILKVLNNFKRISGGSGKDYKKGDTYFKQNPANQPGTGMNLPGEHKIKETEEPKNDSAVLFFAIDTSGSIGQKDFEAIKGYLKTITERFSKPIKTGQNKQNRMAGEVYLLEWDTSLHKPIRRWTRLKRKGKKIVVEPEIKSPSNLPKGQGSPKAWDDVEEVRGGGGTDINGALFGELDNLFLREDDEKKEKAKFVLDDTEDYIATDRTNFKTKSDVKKSPYARIGKHEIEIEYSEKAKVKTNKRIKKVKPDEMDLSSGNINFTNAKQTNDLPFLIIYTDGCFAQANYKYSKLFRNNPGNILYILTMKENVSQISPKNVVFHDLSREHKKGQ